MLAKISAAAHASNAATILAVVSDHGFTPDAPMNLYIPFARAGSSGCRGSRRQGAESVREAQLWLAGGMAAVGHCTIPPIDRPEQSRFAVDPGRDPASGIALVPHEASAAGQLSDAAFLVVFERVLRECKHRGCRGDGGSRPSRRPWVFSRFPGCGLPFCGGSGIAVVGSQCHRHAANPYAGAADGRTPALESRAAARSCETVNKRPHAIDLQSGNFNS